MCFAPQRRALFLTSQLRKVVRTWCALYILTSKCALCTFWTSQLPKVLQAWRALYILTSKCASGHNVVQFFILQLARWLRTGRFRGSLLFDPPEPQVLQNITVIRDIPTFSRTCIFFFLDFFSSLIFSLLLFSSLTLPTSAFPFVHIVGSLTSKLPSVKCVVSW